MGTVTAARAGWVAVVLMLGAAVAAVALGDRAGGRMPAAPGATGTTAGPERRPLVDALARPRVGGVPVRRDPFRFVQPAATDQSAIAAALRDAALQALASASQQPPQPQIRLVGIAESGSGDATIRTAVVSLDGELALVREGERLGQRYRVARITADSVHLEDGDGVPFRVLRWH